MTKAFDLRRPLRRAFRDRRGASALEFAIGGPVLLLAMVAVMELGTVMFMNSALEGGIRDAARFGITGFVPAGTTREDAIRSIVAEHTYGMVDAAALDIQFTIYPSFGTIGAPEPYDDTAPANGSYDQGENFQDINGNGQWDADMGAAGSGGPGDIVVYTVRYNWPLMTPVFTSFVAEGGTLPLEASVAVRNEPFIPAGG